MTSLAIVNKIQDSPVSSFLRTVDHSYIEIFEVLHVLGLLLLLSPLVIVNLRLLRAGLRHQTVAQVFQAFSPFIWAGLGLAAFSGTCLFLTFPVMYYSNPMFLPKIGMLILALSLQATLIRRMTKQTEPHPVLAKGAALFSLTLWFGIGLVGRAIGFV
jgi:hypothetical protein